LNVEVIDSGERLNKEELGLIKEVLSKTANKEKVAINSEVAVSIVTNEEISALNKQYRHKNEATDVLSFQMDNPFTDKEDMPIFIGDIIISIDKVHEQALRYNHSTLRELLFLTIHGFLHLIGYTHDNKEEENIMFRKQENILKEFHLERD